MYYFQPRLRYHPLLLPLHFLRNVRMKACCPYSHAKRKRVKSEQFLSAYIFLASAMIVNATSDLGPILGGVGTTRRDIGMVNLPRRWLSTLTPKREPEAASEPAENTVDVL